MEQQVERDLVHREWAHLLRRLPEAQRTAVVLRHVEDVPTGSRVVFTPTSPDDLGALQNELRMHAGHLQPGSCKMAM